MDKMKISRVEKKRRNILDAARNLFLLNGLRGTTMEAIAREAGIAKPTLYAQYSDKESVFTDVIEDVVESICGVFEVAIEGDGWVAERVGNALSEKFCAFAQLSNGSPHAEDFFSQHKRMAKKFEAFDAQIEADIAAALNAANIADAVVITKAITASAYGIGRTFKTEKEIRDNIMLMCDRMISSTTP